jgi:ketosteroid isomerase-like protein
MSEVQDLDVALHDATLRADPPAIVALFERDAVTLLPGMARLEGQEALGAVLESQKRAGVRFLAFELACGGFETEGSWASEYCEEHHVVSPRAGAPPLDGKGKLLLVLHRGADRVWRIKRATWNEGGRGPVSAD